MARSTVRPTRGSGSTTSGSPPPRSTPAIIPPSPTTTRTPSRRSCRRRSAPRACWPMTPTRTPARPSRPCCVSQPAHGGVTLNHDGSFTYTPADRLLRRRQLHVQGERRPARLERRHRQHHRHAARPARSAGRSGTTTTATASRRCRRSGPGRADGLPRPEPERPARLGRGVDHHGGRRFVRLHGLAPGTYYVAEALPTGWSQTSPAASAERTVVLGGTAQTVFDFNELASTTDQTIGPYHKAGFTFDRL